MPTKTTEKAVKSARRRTTATTPAATTTARATTPRSRRRRQPSHGEIAKRAYFISLEEGSNDEFGNWLRAERELTTA